MQTQFYFFFRPRTSLSRQKCYNFIHQTSNRYKFISLLLTETRCKFSLINSASDSYLLKSVSENSSWLQVNHYTFSNSLIANTYIHFPPNFLTQLLQFDLSLLLLQNFMSFLSAYIVFSSDLIYKLLFLSLLSNLPLLFLSFGLFDLALEID